MYTCAIVIMLDRLSEKFAMSGGCMKFGPGLDHSEFFHLVLHRMRRLW